MPSPFGVFAAMIQDLTGRLKKGIFVTDWSWEPDEASGMRVRLQRANGLDFELVEAGEGDRLALLLHGFPELNHSWRHQIPTLAARGWRVWAPNLRGYGASDRPEGVRAYALDRLVADVAGLIEASGAREVLLMAHDWGAIIAWAVAILHPDLIDRLVILNVPHPRTAEREIRKWRQLRKSWYIFFFQIPWLPEAILGARGASRIGRLFLKSSVDKERFPPDERELYRRAAARPGALTAMLNYYRALLRHRHSVDLGDAIVRVPTLVIWGEQDLALDIHLLDGLEQWVPDLEVVRLPHSSHWVQQDTPEEVNAALEEWLERRG